MTKQFGPFIYEVEHESWVKIVGHTYNIPDELIVPEEIDRLPVFSIERSAFKGVTNITHLVLPNSLKYIEGHAFAECIQLQSVQLNDGLRFIGDCAFHGCLSLDDIRLPDTLRYVSKNAFIGGDHVC